MFVQIQGMFLAFVIYDRLKSKIYAATDAFALHHYSLSLKVKEFVFSSEISGLLALDNNKRRLNLNTTYEYLHIMAAMIDL